MQKVCLKCDHTNPEGMSFCEECGAMLPLGEDEQDPLLGMLLVNKFRINELIGQGAMGRVYSATQEPINRKVAVKILHQHLLEDRRVARRFQREAEAASRFSHPNSIGIFDFGQTEEDALYIAMEYITGRDLADVISREAPLDPERTVRIAVQVLSALHLAHASHIIHRDLKPENIMLSNLPGHKDFVKVCDFGIAKIQQQPGQGQESALTMFGMICGTPYYMSPEQAKGEELDGRTDLYSMGVILYEMLTGEVPFRGSTPVEVIARHLTDPPTPPSKIRPEARVPRALEEVILRALSKERSSRFKDAQEFADELEKALKEAEFQADLERVLQQSGGAPKSNTPPEPLHATDGPTTVHPQAMMQAAMASPSASAPPVATARTTSPPVAAPRGPLPPLAPSALLSQGPPSRGPEISRDTPVPAPGTGMIQQYPPLILTDEIDDEDEFDLKPKKSPMALIFLLVGILAVCAGVYAWYSSDETDGPQARPTPQTPTKQLKNPPRIPALPPRKSPGVRRKGSTAPIYRRATRPRRPRRTRSQASRSQVYRRKYTAKYRRIAIWKSRNQIFNFHLNRHAKNLFHQGKAASKRGDYKKANAYFGKLMRVLRVGRSLPSWAAKNKYQYYNRIYTRVDKRLNNSDRNTIIALSFKIQSALSARQFTEANRLMNRALKILKRY